jgi:hypothetical protein
VGKEYPITVFGKPSKATFDFATEVLKSRLRNQMQFDKEQM